MNYFITGDTHRAVVERLLMLKGAETLEGNTPFNDSLIILGDAGINFYLDDRDRKLKREINELGYMVYCVRGNHEARPEDIPTMYKKFNPTLGNWVYTESDFPHIQYLIDGNEYRFNNYRALVIGGAYSVDKDFRLRTAPQTWFPREQLTLGEMRTIARRTLNKRYDFVFTHTCPYKWRPIDLFLPSLDQSTVDTCMEVWLNGIEHNISYKAWLFGHYHADRDINDHAEMLYQSIVNLDELFAKYN